MLLTYLRLSFIFERDIIYDRQGQAGRRHVIVMTIIDLRTRAAVILLHPEDNVVVCCRAVAAGERARVGDDEEILVREAAELGHKIARRPLQAGTKIVKYGAPIGSATLDVPAGGWVHLHNMKSDYISAHTRALGEDDK